MITHREIYARCIELLNQPVVSKHDFEDLTFDLMCYRLFASDMKRYRRVSRLVQVVRSRYMRTSVHCKGSLVQSRLNAFLSHSFTEALVSRKQVTTTTCRGVSRLASGQSVRRFLSAHMPDFFSPVRGA